MLEEASTKQMLAQGRRERARQDQVSRSLERRRSRSQGTRRRREEEHLEEVEARMMLHQQILGKLTTAAKNRNMRLDERVARSR